MRRSTLKSALRVLPISLLLVALTATTVNAANMVGEKLNLLDPFPPMPPAAQQLPESEPFHVDHGWNVQQGRWNDPESGAGPPIGNWKFELLIDDVPQQLNGQTHRNVSPGEPGGFPHFVHWVFNYRNGMTGSHTFTGLWYAPCEWAVENPENATEPLPIDCGDTVSERIASILFLRRDVPVTFTTP